MMEWGALALAMLLITALVAQLVRVWKQGGFEPREAAADREASTVLQDSKRIPVRDPGVPTEQLGLARPARDAFTARRPPTFRIDTHARNMRRGIILMTILEPCRGVNPFVFRD